jgi:hypothetical protein
MWACGRSEDDIDVRLEMEIQPLRTCSSAGTERYQWLVTAENR